MPPDNNAKLDIRYKIVGWILPVAILLVPVIFHWLNERALIPDQFLDWVFNPWVVGAQLGLLVIWAIAVSASTKSSDQTRAVANGIALGCVLVFCIAVITAIGAIWYLSSIDD